MNISAIFTRLFYNNNNMNSTGIKGLQVKMNVSDILTEMTQAFVFAIKFPHVKTTC